MTLKLSRDITLGLAAADYEPLGRNCRRTLLTQLTDRFFGWTLRNMESSPGPRDHIQIPERRSLTLKSFPGVGPRVYHRRSCPQISWWILFLGHGHGEDINHAVPGPCPWSIITNLLCSLVLKVISWQRRRWRTQGIDPDTENNPALERERMSAQGRYNSHLWLDMTLSWRWRAVSPKVWLVNPWLKARRG